MKMKTEIVCGILGCGTIYELEPQDTMEMYDQPSMTVCPKCGFSEMSIASSGTNDPVEIRARREKISLISRLEQAKILREECPVMANNFRDTAYWHFSVLQPDKLPESLKEEYERLGEIRW